MPAVTITLSTEEFEALRERARLGGRRAYEELATIAREALKPSPKRDRGAKRTPANGNQR